MGTWPQLTAVTLSALIAAELPHVIVRPPATLGLEGGGVQHVPHVEFHGPVTTRSDPNASIPGWTAVTSAIVDERTSERLTVTIIEVGESPYVLRVRFTPPIVTRQA